MLSRKHLLIVGILSLLAIASAIPVYAVSSVNDLKKCEQQVLDLVEKSMPATVCVRSARGAGCGSGVIVSADGLILTAGHVTAATGKDLVVIFPDGRKVKAKALGANRGRDAGMVQITDKGEYPFVPLGKSADLKKNDWCISLGHPGGFDPKRTPPVRLGRVLGNGHFVMTDCALTGGDSGGPLYDIEGRLIGIHSNIGPTLSHNQHVPIDVYHEDWDRMKKGEVWGSLRGAGMDPKRPVLGVQLNPKPAKDGVEVLGTMPNSPAAKAGLKANDIIQQVDDKKVKAMADVIRLVRTKKAGQEVALKLLREGKSVDCKVKLVRASDLQKKQPNPKDAKPQKKDAPEDSDDAKDSDKAKDSDDTKDDKPAQNDAPKDKPKDAPKEDDDSAKADVKPDDKSKKKAKPKRGKKNRKKKPAEESEEDLGELSIEELLKRARENGGRLQLTPKQLQQLQKRMGERMGIMPGMPPGSGGPDKWFEQVMKAYQPVVADAAKNTYRVLVEEKQVALATSVTKNQLVTKASEIDGKEIEIRLADGKSVDAEVVEVFEDHDLALLSVEDVELEPVTWHVPKERPPLGTFVAVAGRSDEPLAIGVISVQPRNLDESEKGYLGVQLKPADKGVEVLEIVAKGPAQKAGLKKGDIILEVNGKAYTHVREFAQAVGSHKPGEKVTLDVRRGDEELSVRVTLGDRSSLSANGRSRGDMMNRMGTQLSDTRTGFHSALQHDCPLLPGHCGGPLVNLDGQVIGINIARAGRVKSYAVPAAIVKKLLSNVVDKS